jgi:hypothetical protein
MYNRMSQGNPREYMHKEILLARIHPRDFIYKKMQLEGNAYTRECVKKGKHIQGKMLRREYIYKGMF